MPEYILAIDVGTASLSGVLCEYKKSGRHKILKVFRHRFNLLSEGFEKRSTKIILGGLRDIFKEAHKLKPGIGCVLFAFSDLLAVEERVKRKIDRKPPHSAIGEAEAEGEIKKISKEITRGNPSMAVVKKEIMGAWVNGYPVKSPAGYRGKFFEFDVSFLAVSRILADNIKMLKETFFPQSHIAYYSDRRVITEALKKTENVFEPTLVVDVGGEVASVFLSEEGATTSAPPIMFGVRTLERRAANFIKGDMAQAESALRQYATGDMDEGKSRKIEKFLDTAMADWLFEFKARVVQIAPHAKKVVVTGGGADLNIFLSEIKKHFAGNQDISVSALKSEAFKDFFVSLDDIQGGRDIVLAALILYC